MKLRKTLGELLYFFWIKTFFKLHKPILITEPGEYKKGFYRLTKDIIVNKENGLKFIGATVLDLNGKTISNLEGMNEWNYGILAEKNIKIYSHAIASIVGFRVGIKLSGNNSSIKNISLRQSRYIGIMIEADNCKISGCTIEDTGGVDDEPYAIAIQVGNSAKTSVKQITIKNIYQQTQYKGKNTGEGLGINFSANSIGCEAKNCILINEEARPGTIGIFCGVRGGHRIEANEVSNFSCGIGAVSDAISSITNNSIKIDRPLPESYGICAEISKVANNFISDNFKIKIFHKNK